jgi:hypothetical protein
MLAVVVTASVVQLAFAAPAQANDPETTWPATLTAYTPQGNESWFRSDADLGLLLSQDLAGEKLANLHTGSTRELSSATTPNTRLYYALSPDGSTVAYQHDIGSPDVDGTFTVLRGLNPSTLENASSMDFDDVDPATPRSRTETDLNSTSFSANGSRLAMGGAAVNIMDTTTGQVTRVVDPVGTNCLMFNEPFDYHQVALSGDGKTLADYVGGQCNGGTTEVKVYDVTNLASPVLVWSAPQEAPPFPNECGGAVDHRASIAINDDGSKVAIARLHVDAGNLKSGSVLIHNLVSGTEQTYFSGSGRICSIALSADGSRLAAQTGDARYPRDSYPDIWGESVQVTDTTPGATPVLLAQNPYNAQFNLYGDAGWSLEGMSDDGTAVLISTHFFSGGSYHTPMYVARDPASLSLGWPAGAALTSSDIGQTFATLHWPAATGGVTSYHLTGGPTPVDVGAGQTSAIVSGLTPATTYHFTIVGKNSNTSTDPLEADLTTAAPAGPGSAALSAQVAADDTVHLLWDPAPGADGYQVLRRTGAGALTPVATVDANVTQPWTDTTTAGATAYTYRVAAIQAGSPVPHTLDATVTTGAVAVTSVTALAPQTLGYVIPGTAVAVHAVGQPNRTATAIPSMQGATPAQVALGETTPGHYDGTFTVPVGATHLDSVTATLADSVGAGAGHTASMTSTTVAVPVGGAVVAHLTTSGYHGRMVASSAAAGWSVAVPIAATGNTTKTLGVPPAGDVAVDYVRNDGQVVHGETSLTVAPGQVVDLGPRAVAEAAQLQLNGGDESAEALLDVTQGSLTRQVRLDSFGAATVTGLDAGQEVTVSLVASDRFSYRFLPMTPASTVVGGGANSLQVPLVRRPSATLGGTVIPGVIDASMVGGTVSIVQEEGSTSQGFSATIDANGQFAVTGLLAGLPTTAAVSVFNAHSQAPTPLTIAAGANHHDLNVQVTAKYLFAPVLKVEDQMGGVQTEPLDWRTALEFGVRLSVGAAVYAGSGGGFASGTFPAYGAPGDPVTLCADGHLGGYGAGCVSTTLPNSVVSPVPLTLTLSAIGHTLVYYSLRTADGASDTSRTVELVATRGAEVVTATALVDDGQFSVPSGTWDVAVVDPATSQVLAELPGGLLTGPTQNLGTVTLAGTGPFTGTGNGLAAQQQSVSPGGVLDVTASWKPSAAQPAGPLTLRLPASVSVADPTVAVTVNGSPVTASVSGDTLTVQLPALAAGVAGHATAHLNVAPGTDPGQVAVRAYVGSTPTPLGIAIVSLPAVTMEAPSRIATGSLTVSGRAQAGAAVAVIADGVEVGSATASATGAWQAPVTLPPGDRHLLVASSGSAVSDSVSVVVDQFAPSFTTVTVSQETVRTFTREPGASYPFVVVPSLPMTVSTTMADADRLTSVDAVADGIHHPMTRTGNTWTTTFVPGGIRGAITFDYVEAPLPVDLSLNQWVPPKPTLAQYLNGLPPATAQGMDQPSATTSPDSHHATVTSGDATVSVTTSNGAGVSHVGKRQLAQGVWVLSEPTLNVSGANVTGSVTLLIHDPAVTRSIGGAGIETLPDTVVELGFVVATGGKSGLEALESGDKYDKISDLLNQATGCSPASFNNFKAQLDDLIKEALATDAAVIALQVGGLLLAPETFGIGSVALWGVGEIYQALLDKRLNDLTQQVANAIAAAQAGPNPDCTPVPPRPGRPGSGPTGPGGPGTGPGANPGWIYDPSGTVTDGVDPIAGATATLSRANTQAGAYSVWDAAAYEQDNDQVTGTNGAYGWNVPEGWYVVTASAPGRLSASSEALQVLPPRTGIDLVLAPDHLPSVTSATAAGDVVTVTFDGWMKAAFLTGSQLTLTDSAGQPVSATLALVGTRTGTDGSSYAKAVTLTVPAPASAIALTLTVGQGVQDVLGRPMAADFTATETIAGASPPGGPPTDCSHQQQAAAAAASAVTAATATLAKARAALAKATKKVSKLKKAHAPATKIKAAKKKQKAAKKAVTTAQGKLTAATSASAAASAAAAACH